ncbi:enterochelin esterase [Martelella alba]|uniref:Enterochelin esterase n=1 Tax=Martelella alba TaxID=2590451 RepID=A0ABY2SKK8_9HYPH|nr:enterochelin esterase [Martelella alba]TKI06119.1 enterochelin esterase [Martelella alba]
MSEPDLMSRADAGSPEWWREVARQGTPLLSENREGGYRATFLWRDPRGNEHTSDVRRVWLNINGLTDHHQGGAPQSLARLPGSDVWHGGVALNPAWRGSYCFIPERGDPVVTSPAAGREWWRARLAGAVHDPVNPLRPWIGARGHALSGLHMPLAPPQTPWREVDMAQGVIKDPPPPTAVRRFRWRSRRLGNSRDVWVLVTGANRPERRPLALLLDGRFWREQMPIAAPLAALTRQGRLPEAVYLLIDSLDNERRGRELPCNADFWLAVQEELLPRLAVWAPYHADPAATVVAGQSFGGLSAVYAALQWPRTFGLALSQSGSFWWPDRDPLSDPRPGHGGELLRQLERDPAAGRALHLYIEAGIREPLIDGVNQRLVALLAPYARRIVYRRIEGGHDALCWRGGLLDGLVALWTGVTPKGACCYPAPFGAPSTGKTSG